MVEKPGDVNGHKAASGTPITAKPPMSPQQSAQIKRTVSDLENKIGRELTGKVISKFGHLFLPYIASCKEDDYEKELGMIETLARNYRQSEIRTAVRSFYDRFGYAALCRAGVDPDEAQREAMLRAVRAQAQTAFTSTPLADEPPTQKSSLARVVEIARAITTMPRNLIDRVTDAVTNLVSREPKEVSDQAAE